MPLPPASPDYPPNHTLNLDTDIGYVAGIDEAGRGPVLGPLVYTLFLVPAAQDGLLRGMGAADSKTLGACERRAFFSRCLAEGGAMSPAWMSRMLTPTDISDAMLRPAKHNLNELSYDAVYSLLQEAFSRGVKIERLCVDTLGDPAKYTQRLLARFPAELRPGQVQVSAKADVLFPAVSAASIIAKVTRDYCLDNWQFARGAEPKSRAFGCGYPSDPLTLQWLNDNLHPVSGFPDIVRFSWLSCRRILEERGRPVRFAYEQAADAAGKKRKSPEPGPETAKTVGHSERCGLRSSSKDLFLDALLNA